MKDVSGSDLYVGGDDGTLTNLGGIARGTLAVPEIKVYLPLVLK